MTTLRDAREEQYIELIMAQKVLSAFVEDQKARSAFNEDHPEYSKLKSNVARAQEKINQRPDGISEEDDLRLYDTTRRKFEGKSGFTAATIHQSGSTKPTIHP